MAEETLSRRNVEIKARVDNPYELISKAKSMAEKIDTLHQADTFFKTQVGRLKLRIERGVKTKLNSYLIFYSRPDQEQATTSTFLTCPIGDPTAFLSMMTASNGILGRSITKDRVLFIHTDENTNIKTRIHVDQVHGIGNFVELEVMLPPNVEEEIGVTIANKLREELNIKDEDLVKRAYFDLLYPKKKTML